MFLIKRDGALVEQAKTIQYVSHQRNGTNVLTGGREYDMVYSPATDKTYEVGAYEVEEVPDAVVLLEAENHLLREQVAALTERNGFHEDLIAEMASVVYA